MLILNYLLIIYFINVCNTFTLMNNKYCANYFSINCKYKLNMGCDYYIDKSLYIYYYDTIFFSCIKLEHNRGYFTDYLLPDQDEDIYEEEYNNYIKNILEPSMKPIIIFNNNTFSKLTFEKKYKKLIDYELDNFNKTWEDINLIIKKEKRYER